MKIVKQLCVHRRISFGDMAYLLDIPRAYAVLACGNYKGFDKERLAIATFFGYITWGELEYRNGETKRISRLSRAILEPRRTIIEQAGTASKIHDTIFEKIGATLSVIIKTKDQFAVAIKENPFDDTYDFSRIHLAFTNNQIDTVKINKIKEIVFDGEIFCNGTECFYYTYLVYH